MTDAPKPGLWMFWTVLFAVLTVVADGSWWQVPTLALLAVSGGTWAVENRRWEQRKAQQVHPKGDQALVVEHAEHASQHSNRQVH